jgi:2'-5' RNA ligase
MPGMLRTFVAAELPTDLLKALAAVQTELGRRGLRARWTLPGNLHLTLKFLGDIPADRVPIAATALRTTAAEHDAFGLTAEGIGVFPGMRRPRVLWAGLSGGTAELERLQRGLDDRLHAAGFPREARDFHGHLTLGRFAETPGGGIAEALMCGRSSCSRAICSPGGRCTRHWQGRR